VYFLVQLAISPSQPINNEPHSISVESQMALKIEGVVCHGKDAQVFRKIKFIKLLVEITSEERKEFTDLKVIFVFRVWKPPENMAKKQCFLVCPPLENMTRKQCFLFRNETHVSYNFFLHTDIVEHATWSSTADCGAA
jgi:hypothetical protein